MITAELRTETPPPRARQTQVLRLVGVSPSSWHRPARASERKRPGPARRMIADEVVQAVVEMATTNPWYGYKRIAVMCRRSRQAVKDREAYVVMKRPRFIAEAKDSAGRGLSGGQAVRIAAARTERPVADGRDVHSHPWVRLVVRGDGDRLLLAVLARLSPDAVLLILTLCSKLPAPCFYKRIANAVAVQPGGHFIARPPSR